VAQKAVTSDKAQALAAETGALVYWQDAASVSAQIQSDIATLDRIGTMLGN
jgi:hypothetical protein